MLPFQTAQLSVTFYVSFLTQRLRYTQSKVQSEDRQFSWVTPQIPISSQNTRQSRSTQRQLWGSCMGISWPDQADMQSQPLCEWGCLRFYSRSIPKCPIVTKVLSSPSAMWFAFDVSGFYLFAFCSVTEFSGVNPCPACKYPVDLNVGNTSNTEAKMTVVSQKLCFWVSCFLSQLQL